MFWIFCNIIFKIAPVLKIQFRFKCFVVCALVFVFVFVCRHAFHSVHAQVRGSEETLWSYFSLPPFPRLWGSHSVHALSYNVPAPCSLVTVSSCAFVAMAAGVMGSSGLASGLANTFTDLCVHFPSLLSPGFVHDVGLANSRGPKCRCG